MNVELALIVGAKARKARERFGLTQADVAERLGIAMEVYSRMERGKLLPSTTTLRKMAAVLHIRTDALLGLEVDDSETPAANGPPVSADEDPPRLRRLVRILRALEPAELKSVLWVVHGALGLLPKKQKTT